MLEKLSERIPMQLSCEEGWKMDTVDLANWLKELAQHVEALEPENADPTEALRSIQEVGEEPPTDAVLRKLRQERDDLVCQTKERVREMGDDEGWGCATTGE